MTRQPAAVAIFGLCLLGTACGVPYRPSPTGPLTRLAPPNLAPGDLAIRIVYPPTAPEVLRLADTTFVTAEEGYRIQSRDSAFVFGSVGRGDARLTVNGRPVPVYPTGGWIAWLPLPDDTVARFDAVAVAGPDTMRLAMVVPIAGAPARWDAPVWIDTTTMSPVGDRWIAPDEGLLLSVLATPGARVRGILPDGREIQFVAESAPQELSWGMRAFSTEPPSGGTGVVRPDRYQAWWVGPLGPDPDLILAPNFPDAPSDPQWMRIEAVVGADTAWARWPLRLGVTDRRAPVVVTVDDDPSGTGQTDGVLAGRPSPYGTYHWFLPNGTRAAVSGRWNSQVRLQLSRTSVAWVDAANVHPLPPGTPPPRAIARSMRLFPGEHSVTLRIPLSERVAFRVDESERALLLTLYGVAADMDWIQYGGTDPLVESIAFGQPKEDEASVEVTLSSPVWGYRTRWDGLDLLLEIRRPPRIDLIQPLLGRTIALDAGHPPGGATGPTGIREPDVVLEVAREAARLLRRYGAQPVLVRESDAPVGLEQRIAAAERADADVLISIHANALPDGVNPFINNGTSVYYFHPRSAPLARALDRALVRQFGYPDLGMGRGDLALVRPTWMPAALTEGLFMMIPEQEAVLASREGRLRYARGVVEGVAAFLRACAVAQQ